MNKSSIVLATGAAQEAFVKAEAANEAASDAAREAYESALVAFNQATRNVKSASTVVSSLVVVT